MDLGLENIESIFNLTCRHEIDTVDDEFFRVDVVIIEVIWVWARVEMLVGDVDAYFFLEVFDDGPIECHIFMFDVSFDGCFDGCKAKVKWFFAKLSFFNDLLIAFLFFDGFDIDCFFSFFQVDGVEVGSSHPYLLWS